jgi:hypothetical protein
MSVLPLTLIDPVNTCVLSIIDPNLVLPVTKSTLDVIVCTTNVCAVNVDATVNAFAKDAVCAETAFDADCAKATNEAVCAKATNEAVAAYDADKAFEPEITPVVVIAPEELIDIRVVEPLTNVTLPLASVFMMLAKPLISLTLLILVYVVAF